MTKRKAQKARILRSKIIYRGPVFGIRRDELLEPGGLRTTRDPPKWHIDSKDRNVTRRVVPRSRYRSQFAGTDERPTGRVC